MGESAKFIHVDNDTVDEFVKENFPNLRSDKAVLAKRTPSDPDLRLLIPRLVAEYALKENYSVIATAAHPRRVIRQDYYDLAKRNGAKVVLLNFEIDETVAQERIRQAGRDAGILDTSPHGGSTFTELFERQKSILEPPTEAEKQGCYKVLEISPENYDQALEEAAELVRSEYKLATTLVRY